jgi:uncharacterized membrane protein YeaQ/YmgE (transglycosylase-associated protein family)
MLGLIVYLVIVGIVAGYLARLLVPGRDPMSFVQTMVLGIVGSFVGGFLGYILFDKDLAEGGIQASGLIGSVLGAIVALLVYRAVGGTSRGRGRSRRRVA